MVTVTPEIKPFRVRHPSPDCCSPGQKCSKPINQIDVNLNPPQTLLIDSKAQIPVLQSGTQVGKTVGLVEWLAQEMHRCGPGDYMFVSPTFPLMERKVIAELKERFVDITHEFIYQPGYHRFISHDKINGNPAFTIMLGSAVNPDSLESATLKAVAIDEIAQRQFPRESWEAIIRRINVNKGRIACGTTLYDVSSWYKTDIYDKWRAGDPRFEIIQADSIENPAFPREAYEQAKLDLPYWKFRMQYQGCYERPTGLIYDGFDEETQVIDGFNLKLPMYEGWPRFTGHDFGLNNTAAIWIAQDPGTGLLYLYREYHRGELSLGQHAEEFKRLSQGENVMRRVGGSWGEEEIRWGYRAAGWPIGKPDVKDVEAGISRVYSFVAKNQLFVFRECREFINEILSYTHDLDENYEGTDKILNKSRFHLLDSLRYLLSSFPTERANVATEAKMKVTRPSRSRSGMDRRGRAWLPARR